MGHLAGSTPRPNDSYTGDLAASPDRTELKDSCHGNGERVPSYGVRSLRFRPTPFVIGGDSVARTFVRSYCFVFIMVCETLESRVAS